MKSGYKTTEFWVIICTILGSIFTSLGGVLDEKTTITAAVVASAYAISRVIEKAFSSDKVKD